VTSVRSELSLLTLEMDMAIRIYYGPGQTS